METTTMKETTMMEETATINRRVAHNAPKSISVHGEIVSVDELINKDNEKKGILVSIFDVKTQKIYKAITSEGQLDKFTSNGQKYQEIVAKGSQCSANLDIHIEGQTEYIDENGDTKIHKSSGYSLREILPLSSFQTNYFNARNTEQVKIDMEKENLKDRVNSRIEVLMGLGYSREDAQKSVLSMMSL